MNGFEAPEGATPLDRDEMAGLIPAHVTLRSELDRWEQDNILRAYAWLDRTRPADILNETFVRELHRRMFGRVWRWAGQFRRSDKNIGVPWPDVSVRLRTLCDDARYWMEQHTYEPDEQAARLHHRLVSIHPFVNGNGRHARLFTDLFLENLHHLPRFTWGGDLLTQPSVMRRTYLEALRAADRHDLGPLLQFVRA